MMFAIVTAWEDEEQAKELEAAGYRKREVYFKWVDESDKVMTERELREKQVPQFLVSNYWGRTPE